MRGRERASRALGFYLQGDVIDAVMLTKLMRGFEKKLVIRATVAHHQMSRERNFRGAHRPNMKIVYASNARPAQQHLFHVDQVDCGRHGVPRHRDTVPKQVPRPITPTITRLTAGSSQSHPVSKITKPEATTPAEIAASAAIYDVLGGPGRLWEVEGADRRSIPHWGRWKNGSGGISACWASSVS